MVARSLSLPLRADPVEEFTRTIEHEVIPMIRGLKGFQDKIFSCPAKRGFRQKKKRGVQCS